MSQVGLHCLLENTVLNFVHTSPFLLYTLYMPSHHHNTILSSDSDLLISSQSNISDCDNSDSLKSASLDSGIESMSSRVSSLMSVCYLISYGWFFFLLGTFQAYINWAPDAGH